MTRPKIAAVTLVLLGALFSGGGCITTKPDIPSLLNDPWVQCPAAYLTYKEWVQSGRGGRDEHEGFAEAYTSLRARCAAKGVDIPAVIRL